MLRPSKNYLMKILETDLKFLDYRTVVEVASADFRFSNLFSEKEYFGVDIDKSLLEKGLKKNSIGTAIFADITRISNSGSIADLIVSLNTINHIPDCRNRMIAIKNLICMVNKNGSMLLQMNIDATLSATVSLLKENFHIVKYEKYNNRISQLFEKVFIDSVNPSLTYQLYKILPLQIISKILGRFESLGFGISRCKFIYISCYVKKTKSQQLNFELIEKLGDRFYRLN